MAKSITSRSDFDIVSRRVKFKQEKAIFKLNHELETQGKKDLSTSGFKKYQTF